MKTIEQELVTKSNSSLSFFKKRLKDTFPDTKGIKWFNNSKEVGRKLEEVLKAPLLFNSRHECDPIDPIWWLRGDRDNYIENFKLIEGSRVLMSVSEFNIKRIAVNISDKDYKNFIYVESDIENPIGLYNYVKGAKFKNGFYEEYGIIENDFSEDTLIDVKNHYDGYIELENGEVKDISGRSKYRRRYLGKFNFIIAAKESSYNHYIFDKYAKDFFDKILNKEIDAIDFFKFLSTFDLG